MAVNKRKVLDAARKYAQKGAKEKALKEYHTLLKLDPRDAKLHLEIGDCYRRWGQIDEAVTQYSRVAEQYKDDGFDARAVAVFKQILNLDPKRYSGYVALSELYQRMGLDAEALSALQAAADGYHKEGNKREALELLRKMATLDPTNTTSRLKVAELLRQEGLESEAVSEYEAVVAELQRQGASESILAVQERILELQPNRVDVLVAIGQQLVQLDKAERAEPFARRALESDPEQAEAYEILIEVYKALGNDQELASTTRTLAKMYRDRGDSERARELTQRIPLELELEDGDSSAGIEESESTFLSDDELLDDDFLASDGSETREVSEQLPLDDDELVLDDDPEPDASEEIDLSEPDPEPQPKAGAKPEPKAAAPEGDPDQLLAEASVYLRYGKRDQAITSLEAILARESEHRGALEKLGEALADGEDDDRAVEVWTRAARCARSEGDDEGFAVLRDRIANLDEAAAAQLDAEGPASPIDDEVIESELPEEPDAGIEFEMEDPDDAADDAFEIDVSSDVEEDIQAHAEEDTEDDVEIDISEDAVADALEPDADLGIDDDEFAVEDDVSGADTFDEADEEDVELDIDLEDGDEPEDDDHEDEQAAAASGSNTTSQQVSEDLEEAEFYYQQKLFDEAEAIYRRVLKLAPSHPSALLRLGELAAAKGDDPAELDSKPAARAASGVESQDAPRRAPGRAAGPGEDSTEVADLGGLDDEEPAVQLDAPPPRESAPVSRADDTLPIADDVEDLDAGLDDDAEEEGAGGFDLAAELRDVLEEPDDGETSVDGVLSTVEDGFESIFADFKQGVSATLSDDDFETRYDLGIAYREMGLYEDAIGEFRMCLGSPGRKLESLHMMGLCALDLGRSQDAVNHLEQALATPDLPIEQVAGLQFDLGRALEVAGDVDRARSAYEAALEADAGFPGAAERIEGLGEATAEDAPVELEQEGAGGGFETFDDIVAEAQDDGDDDTEQTESFESFDDVITEAEAAIEDEDDATEETDAGSAAEAAATEAELEPLPESEEPPARQSPGKKPKGKKRISFV